MSFWTEAGLLDIFRQVRSNTIFIWVLILTFLTGCAGSKAFMDLPAGQQQHIRFVPHPDQRPHVRFASEAARKGREFGGIIGLAISEGIEHSTNAFGNVGSVMGRFETQTIQNLFVARLQAASIEIESPLQDAPRLELQVRSIGLREVEREDFAVFADISACLTAPDGRKLWAARAQSTGLQIHTMKEFRENPELYRRDFSDVARDLVNQLIAGPVRAARF